MNLFTSLVPLILILVVILVATKFLVAFLRSTSRPSKTPSNLPYKPVPLLTPTELSFMRLLEQAVESGYRILTKVRMSDVIDVEEGLRGSEKQSALNKIQSKHLDFLICDGDYSVICAVELDDSSHEREDRQESDDLKNRALWAAGITLVRFNAEGRHSVQDVRSALEKATNQIPVTTTASQTTTPRPIPPPPTPPPQPPPPARPFPIPTCPFCGVPMVRRTATSGANVGKDFWGCPNYPKCKGMLRV